MNPPTVGDLLEQQYLFDPSVKVGQLLVSESKKLGAELRVGHLLRFACGENVEKKQSNLAQEVSEILRR
jgi:elongation factor Ts